MKLGSLEIRNTRNLVSTDTRIAALLYSPAKYGKTELASSLNDITLKYRGKPSLFIACEVAEGGGTMTLHRKDMDYVMPSNWREMEEILAALAGDEKYGGVILDNATDYIVRIVRPYALKFPSKEDNSKFSGPRIHGVPMRSDYQTMAECARQQLNKLLNLTNETTAPNVRKDLIVTALEKEVSDDNGNISAIKPALPGALADVVTAMFQSVVSLRIKPRIVGSANNTRSIPARQLMVLEGGTKIMGDRCGLWKNEQSLTDDNGKPIGLLPMYEAWLEEVKKDVR